MTASQGSGPERPVTPQPAVMSGLGARVGRDLGPRVASGLVIGAVALGAIWAGPIPFAILTALVVAVVAWEWGRIVRGVERDQARTVHIASAVASVLLTSFGMIGPALGVVLIGAGLTNLLSRRRHPLLSMTGVVVTGFAGMALAWLRDDPTLGPAAIYFVGSAVAATDVAAYFSGRLIGGPKLWPAVSPNKTWAGLAGGVGAACIVGAVTGTLVAGAHPLHLTGLAALLALLAQAGDLAESGLKRHFGAKDASQLIPGHGGFMDRVDGLATAAIAAALWAAIHDPAAPARALLTW